MITHLVHATNTNIQTNLSKFSGQWKKYQLINDPTNWYIGIAIEWLWLPRAELIIPLTETREGYGFPGRFFFFFLIRSSRQ